MHLEFSVRGRSVDEFNLPVGLASFSLPKPPAAVVALDSSGDSIEVAGPGFTIAISPSTGLIRNAVRQGQTILHGGPYVDLGGGPLIAHWLLRSFEMVHRPGFIEILTSGECKRGEGIDSIPVDFAMRIDGSGRIETRYPPIFEHAKRVAHMAGVVNAIAKAAISWAAWRFLPLRISVTPVAICPRAKASNSSQNRLFSSIMRQYSREAMAMATFPTFAAPGYQFDTVPDLSRLETRERLSQSAINGFFAIIDKWQIPIERAGDLLGGMPRSTVYKLKSAAGTLRQDELTRISYIVGIYKALHILLPDDLADRWVTQPNDNPLFRGQAPVDYIVRSGIPGLQRVRSLVDAERGGH